MGNACGYEEESIVIDDPYNKAKNSFCPPGLLKARKEKLRRDAPYQEYDSNSYWKDLYYGFCKILLSYIQDEAVTWSVKIEPLAGPYVEFTRYFMEQYIPRKVRETYGYTVIITSSGDNCEYRVVAYGNDPYSEPFSQGYFQNPQVPTNYGPNIQVVYPS